MDFKKLEHIVMEGGGARGAAYLGAIEALEKLMEDRFNNDSNVERHTLSGDRPHGLLDYYEVATGAPVIKGIAGSSAGAITTFALGLGLNSKEIGKVLDYPFAKFLEEKDAGKYRAIDENGNLAVGQDRKNEVTNAKELAVDKKFEFRFDQDKTTVNGNVVKLGLRNLYFTLVTKVVIDGAGSNLNQLFDLQRKLDKATDATFLSSFWSKVWKFVLRTDNSFLQKLGWQKLLNLLLFKLVLPKALKAPMKFDADNFTNLISDRGMYSGFAVREFFMDLVLFAATRDTQFQRGLLKQIPEGERSALKTQLNEAGKNFEIGKRSGAKLMETIKNKKIFGIVADLTFFEFRQITRINFGMCVSSLTSGFPLYFGSEWTPDFRVMEAVAGSMTIPPAIKLLYNASNVVKGGSRAVTVDCSGGRQEFVDRDGKFSVEDYHFYNHIVKMALAQEIKSKTGSDISINVNNTIDLSAFLPELRKIVVGEYVTDQAGEIVWQNVDETIRTTLEDKVNGETYTVDYPLYRFFYNAGFKGLLLDGGYRNNIPYNFFRGVSGIDTVCAIKLDEHFPPPLLQSIYRSIEGVLAKVDRNQLIEYYELADLEDSLLNAVIEQLSLGDREVRLTVREQARKIFADYLAQGEAKVKNESGRAKRRAAAKQVTRNDKAIKRLAKAVLKDYRKNRLTPPWMQPVAIFASAFDGYSYGSEKGQVRHVSDHNHILPLYDYGVGTFDFDMKKVQPMIQMAQVEAYYDTMEFFGGEP